MYSSASLANEYYEIFTINGLSAAVNSVTHKAGNKLDNVLIDDSTHSTNFMIDTDCTLSDHSPIFFECWINNSISLLLCQAATL